MSGEGKGGRAGVTLAHLRAEETADGGRRGEKGGRRLACPLAHFVRFFRLAGASSGASGGGETIRWTFFF